MPVVLPGLMRVCGRQSIMTPIMLQCVCVTALRMRGRALFPQAVTGAAAEPSVTWPARGSVREFLCLRVCLSFCLISTSCFILGVIQTQHSCAVSQRKRAWGMGCQGLVSPAMLGPTDGREMGLPAWAYLLFVGQTDPTQTQLPIP